MINNSITHLGEHLVIRTQYVGNKYFHRWLCQIIEYGNLVANEYDSDRLKCQNKAHQGYLNRRFELLDACMDDYIQLAYGVSRQELELKNKK